MSPWVLRLTLSGKQGLPPVARPRPVVVNLKLFLSKLNFDIVAVIILNLTRDNFHHSKYSTVLKPEKQSQKHSDSMDGVIETRENDLTTQVPKLTQIFTGLDLVF